MQKWSEDVLKPTAKNVRKMVTNMQTRDDITQAEIADVLGVSVSSLKKNLMEGKCHRPMSNSTWQLLLLMADHHPLYELQHRHPLK